MPLLMVYKSWKKWDDLSLFHHRTDRRAHFTSALWMAITPLLFVLETKIQMVLKRREDELYGGIWCITVAKSIQEKYCCLNRQKNQFCLYVPYDVRFTLPWFLNHFWSREKMVKVVVSGSRCKWVRGNRQPVTVNGLVQITSLSTQLSTQSGFYRSHSPT